MSERDGLYERDDLPFYEWLLSDNPEARAERDRRRTQCHRAERDRALQVLAWATKINVTPDAPGTLRDLAATMGLLAARSLERAEAGQAEPDDLYVKRLRDQHETYMRVSGPAGSWDYRYPAHLTGPEAAYYPPPQPDADGVEPGV